MKHPNELVILEQFKIKPSKEEKQNLEDIKQALKKNPIWTGGVFLFAVLLSPFSKDAQDLCLDTFDNFKTIYKSSIRDYAISTVSANLRKKNVKVYEVETKKLEKLILKEEQNITDKRNNGLIRKVIFLALGINILPFL